MFNVLAVHVFFFVATFRVARLTLQTPKLWLVGVATDRGARHACLRFFGPEMLLFVIQQNETRSSRGELEHSGAPSKMKGPRSRNNDEDERRSKKRT